MLMPRYSEPDSHSDTSFAVKHGHASTTVAAHTKMRLISKVEHNMRQSQQQQQQPSPVPNQTSINKLINTAATGNGVVGDVDELLTPMRIKSIVSGLSAVSGSGANWSGDKEVSPHSRPERNLWSRAEMLEMLSIMQQMNALEQLNDRNVKSEHVFRQIEEVMRSKGYVKKSSIQIWTKWKFLKSTYNTTTRHGNGIPKVVPEEVYRVLCRMLREHASASANGSGSGISSECGNSRDSSTAELGKSLANSDDVKEEMGVEHPIFGFRLGLIKPEPLDTGYDSTLNNSITMEQEIEAVDFLQSGESIYDEPQSLEHTPFLVNVKHEPEMDLGMDGTNTPPPTAPTSPSPPPSSLQEQRDTDDSSPPTAKLQGTAIPPLRVAAFANDTQRLVTSTPKHGILQIERPATLVGKNGLNGGPGRGNRSMPLHSTSSINFVHPTSKLMLPRKQLPMRIPREISVQPAKVRGLKSVPMRETGYSLRPDRMIPDLERSNSPSQSPSPPMHGKPVPKYSIPYATTSRQAQVITDQQQLQQLEVPQRKRRLQFVQQPPVPVKLQRSSTLFDSKPNGGFRHEDASAAEEQRSSLVAEETQRRKHQQKEQHLQQEELFKKELTELASALRSAQKEMLQDFFQQQKQLARREHEFQLKQDNLVMSALRKQTNALLRTAKDLMQSDEKVEEAEAETEQQPECLMQLKEDCSSSILLLQPEIDLLKEQEPQSKHHENEETELDAELAQYEEETQYSEEANQSEAAMEASTSAGSEDAFCHSDHPSDAQMC